MFCKYIVFLRLFTSNSNIIVTQVRYNKQTENKYFTVILSVLGCLTLMLKLRRNKSIVIGHILLCMICFQNVKNSWRA